eukprot:TRINITY_DN10329_c0_g1_i1.p1 TRINITY_DN10329_c0_g1~~TRINITY_DN10329_c0_g1_i1.p1  ORF type:complete len:950 (+),score=295.66 TRINITY_DN10329_c0_g1_i1:233-2851(+)
MWDWVRQLGDVDDPRCGWAVQTVASLKAQRVNNPRNRELGRQWIRLALNTATLTAALQLVYERCGAHADAFYLPHAVVRSAAMHAAFIDHITPIGGADLDTRRGGAPDGGTPPCFSLGVGNARDHVLPELRDDIPGRNDAPVLHLPVAKPPAAGGKKRSGSRSRRTPASTPPTQHLAHPVELSGALSASASDEEPEVVEVRRELERWRAAREVPGPSAADAAPLTNRLPDDLPAAAALAPHVAAKARVAILNTHGVEAYLRPAPADAAALAAFALWVRSEAAAVEAAGRRLPAFAAAAGGGSPAPSPPTVPEEPSTAAEEDAPPPEAPAGGVENADAAPPMAGRFTLCHRPSSARVTVDADAAPPQLLFSRLRHPAAFRAAPDGQLIHCGTGRAVAEEEGGLLVLTEGGGSARVKCIYTEGGAFCSSAAVGLRPAGDAVDDTDDPVEAVAAPASDRGVFVEPLGDASPVCGAAEGGRVSALGGEAYIDPTILLSTLPPAAFRRKATPEPAAAPPPLEPEPEPAALPPAAEEPPVDGAVVFTSHFENAGALQQDEAVLAATPPPEEAGPLDAQLKKSFDWAVTSDRDAYARHRLRLVTDVKRKHGDYAEKERRIAAQGGKCKGCLSQVKKTYSTMHFAWRYDTVRFCYYTGMYYCNGCHDNTLTHTIPARLVHDWDAAAKPVCHDAYLYLTSLWDRPVLCVSAVNPQLFVAASTLQLMRGIRVQLGILHGIVGTCPDFNAYVEARPELITPATLYYLQETELYSLADVASCQQHQPTLYQKAHAVPPALARLERLRNTIIEHVVKQCPTHCFPKAAQTCGACTAAGRRGDKATVYAFDVQRVQTCTRCGAAFHKACYQRTACTRCAAARAEKA